MFALKQYIEKIHTNKINGKNLNLFDNFYACLGILEFVDLLIQFGVGGLYALCNKSDCEGFYSVGNSYDICALIKLIKPFLLKNKDNIDAEENWLYREIDELIDVFKEGVEKNEIVKIC